MLNNLKENRKLLFELLETHTKLSTKDVKNIHLNKQGMTNTSYIVESEKGSFIIRLPGEGTKKLINRYHEEEVYKVLNENFCEFCEEIIFFDSENGIKISKYIETSAVCNPYDMREVKSCLEVLKGLHDKKLKVNFIFDIFENIDFYEKIRGSIVSRYSNYASLKENIISLRGYIDKYKSDYSLSHIDAVSDNFLLSKNKVYLIDWEYAAMQDPHIDIAMFCLYNKYSKAQIDSIIDIYFNQNPCENEIRIKIYAYIAACGLLWSNWCECKMNRGIEFSQYAKNQYSYANDYFEIVRNEI